MRKIVRIPYLPALLVIASLAPAQEFSADAVNLKSDSTQTVSKVYVGKDKIRLEMQNRQGGPGAMTSGAMIFDEAQNKRVVLIPERHMYMDFGQFQRFPAIVNLWRPADVNDACPQWRKVSEQLPHSKFGTCKNVGGDSVNGRNAIKYEGTSTDGKTTYVWIDAKLRCVVKAEDTTGGSVELRNIHEGAQPASLFEIPADYTKMDMGSMMQQHSQK